MKNVITSLLFFLGTNLIALTQTLTVNEPSHCLPFQENEILPFQITVSDLPVGTDSIQLIFEFTDANNESIPYQFGHSGMFTDAVSFVHYIPFNSIPNIVQNALSPFKTRAHFFKQGSTLITFPSNYSGNVHFLNPPHFSIVGDFGENTFCENEMLNLSSSSSEAYFYYWLNNNGDTLANNTSIFNIELIQDTSIRVLAVHPTNNCTKDTMLHFFVASKIDLIAPQDTSICQGDSLQFNFTNESSLLVTYANDTLADSLTQSITLHPNNDGMLLLHPINEADCIQKDSLQIDVQSPPILSDSIENVLQVENGTDFQIHLSEEAVAYKWSTYFQGMSYNDSGFDSLIVYNLNLENETIRDSAIFEIQIRNNQCLPDTIFYKTVMVEASEEPVETPNPNNTDILFIPDLFTPNNDGSNDFWGIEVLNTNYQKSDFTLNILNKNGAVIYQGDLLENWDAQDVADGTYWYIIHNTIEQTEYIGAVTLIRQ